MSERETTSRRPRKMAGLLALTLGTLFGTAVAAPDAVPSFGLSQEPTLRESADEPNLVFIAEWHKGELIRADLGSAGKRYLAKPKRIKEPWPQEPARLHPLVARWLQERKGEEMVELVISTRETVKVPRARRQSAP